FDHVPLLAMSARIRYDAPVYHRRLADRFHVGPPLLRVNPEAHPVATVPPEGLDQVGVQRRRARARVDLRLDAPDAELRQADPLAPAQDDPMIGIGNSVQGSVLQPQLWSTAFDCWNSSTVAFASRVSSKRAR